MYIDLDEINFKHTLNCSWLQDSLELKCSAEKIKISIQHQSDFSILARSVHIVICKNFKRNNIFKKLENQK